MLSYIFNLSTRKLKTRSVKSDPAAFLRSLFLPSGTSPSANSSQDEGADDNQKSAGHQRQRSHSKQRKPKSPEYARSRSFPNNLGQTESVIPPPPLSILKPQPIYPAGPSRLPYSFTESVPSIHRRKKTKSHSKALHQLPQALVISGLENASNSVQRALSDVLSEKRVVLEGEEDGVWNLPEGFITVYVCPWNARERPAIHKTLVSVLLSINSSSNVSTVRQVCDEYKCLHLAGHPARAALVAVLTRPATVPSQLSFALQPRDSFADGDDTTPTYPHPADLYQASAVTPQVVVIF